MSKEATFLQAGKVINWTNSTEANVAVGEVIPLTSIVAVAVTNIPIGAIGAVSLEGIYQMPADKTTTFAVGDKLYWDATAGNLTKTDTANVYAGICVEPKNNSTETALVKLG